MPLIPEYAAHSVLRVRGEIFSLIPTLTPAQIIEALSRLSEEITEGSDLGEDSEEFWQSAALHPEKAPLMHEGRLCAAIRRDLLSLCRLECMSEEWHLCVAGAAEKLTRHPSEFVKFLNTDYSPYFARLIFYFIHRYMYEGVFLAEVGARVRFSLACAMSISALCYASEAGDFATVAKDFSKNVEYSEQNLAILISGGAEEDFLYGESLAEAFH